MVAKTDNVFMGGLLLSQKGLPGRVVGAMDRRMTIRAGAVNFSSVHVVERALIIERPGVSRVGMASLAKERGFGVEQLEMVGTVRLVAIQAVFPDRDVFPEERASLLRVALITLFVDGGLVHQFSFQNAVRIVAIRTGHFSLSDRMMRGPEELRLLLLVAAKTGVRFDFGFQLVFF
jgi:hypothetical protein